MADDGDRARSASGLIALLLLAISAIVVKQLPYSSARPTTADRTAPAVESSQNVVARLWQDPFVVVLGLGFLAGCALSLRRMAERVRANTRETLAARRRHRRPARARPPRRPRMPAPPTSSRASSPRSTRSTRAPSRRSASSRSCGRRCFR